MRPAFTTHIVRLLVFVLCAASPVSTLTFAQTAAGSTYANPGIAGSNPVASPPVPTALSPVYFSIVNARDEKVSREEADKIYLSTCELLARQLGRTDALRPRFKLILGGNKNVLDFRKHEIHLEKWDGYRFAEGVIELALYNMMPAEEKTRLRDLAVTEAKGIVSLCELKACTN